MKVSVLARETAKKWHEEVNQKYGSGLPYSFHTDLAGQIANIYISLIPEQAQEDVLAAVYLHDTIEDCRKTYNDVKKVFGTTVADLVYAVTNEKGRTRKERANLRYYHGIRDTKYATFVKLCDRFANVLYGIMFNSDMSEMYKREHQTLKAELFTEAMYNDMFYDLEVLLSTNIINFTPLQFRKDFTRQ